MKENPNTSTCRNQGVKFVPQAEPQTLRSLRSLVNGCPVDYPSIDVSVLQEIASHRCNNIARELEVWENTLWKAWLEVI